MCPNYYLGITICLAALFGISLTTRTFGVTFSGTTARSFAASRKFLEFVPENVTPMLLFIPPVIHPLTPDVEPTALLRGRRVVCLHQTCSAVCFAGCDSSGMQESPLPGTSVRKVHCRCLIDEWCTCVKLLCKNDRGRSYSSQNTQVPM